MLAKVCAESSESGSEKAVDAVAPLQRLTQRINQGGVETFQRLTLLKRCFISCTFPHSVT